MTGTEPTRRLAALLFADAVGFSAMMEADENAALGALRAARAEVLDPALAGHGGRVVKTTGDGLLAEFPSAVEAMRCAMTVQNAMAGRDGALRLRMGINVGDVLADGDDLFGDGVNVAARLEGLAPPGGVAFSGAVRDHLGGLVEAAFEDAGERELKNIARRVRVWLWRPSAAAAPAERDHDGAPPPLPDKPSIAVLPFDDMSGGADQGHFADAVTESITAELSRIRQFFVIARNSAFAYKGRAVNVRDIGRELGVAYLLEGSVQRAGQRVRITVQLIETAGGAHLWAEKYDGSVDDIFDLQDRITAQVAGALQPSIRGAEIERSRRKRPQDMGAYDFAMRAMPHVWVLEKDEAARALELLEQALARDPDYPLALALAAWCWAQRSVYNWTTDFADARARALAYAEAAAGRSTDDPLILAVLGAVHTFARNYGAARVLLERAVALDPNAAWALNRLGWLEVYSDRPDEARAYFEKAMRLSPLDPHNFNNLVGLASARQAAGDDAAAADLFIRALQERPNALWIHRNLAPALLGAGREEEARASAAAMMAAYPDITVRRFCDAMVFSPRFLARIGDQLLALGVPEG